MSDNIPDPAVYRAAADVIRTNGWVQEDYYDSTKGLAPAQCPVCASGAVHVALGVAPDDVELTAGPVLLWLAQVLGLRDTEEPGDLADVADAYVAFDVERWNDAPERTVDEVLDALERAAKAAESARAEAAQDGGEGRG